MKIRNLHKGKDFSFYTLKQLQLDEIKLAEPMVPAGFPSPCYTTIWNNLLKVKI